MKLHHRLFATAILAAGAPLASAKTCQVAIEGNDVMQYNLKEIKIGADCTAVQVTLKHTGKLAASIMGHNWVLAKTADLQPLANDGMKAGLPNGFLPKGDPRVLASTKIVGGGESTAVTFSTSTLVRGGDYSYFCSFPGHVALMRGRFIFG